MQNNIKLKSIKLGFETNGQKNLKKEKNFKFFVKIYIFFASFLIVGPLYLCFLDIKMTPGIGV